jgi:hypothetical protein
MTQLLCVWFTATAVIVTGFVLWAYVPVLIPFLVIAAGLGAITFGIVQLARFAERRMYPRGREPLE